MRDEVNTDSLRSHRDKRSVQLWAQMWLIVAWLLRTWGRGLNTTWHWMTQGTLQVLGLIEICCDRIGTSQVPS